MQFSACRLVLLRSPIRVYQTHLCVLQVRVYTKKVGHKPDFEQPVVLTSDRGGTSMEAMCKQIHNTLIREFKYALVWGVSAKHYPQRVGLQHGLSDEDVVQVSHMAGMRLLLVLMPSLCAERSVVLCWCVAELPTAVAPAHC